MKIPAELTPIAYDISKQVYEKHLTFSEGQKIVVGDNKMNKRIHTTVVFKTSEWTTDSVAIKYIKPDLAILHMKWGIKGDFDPDGTPRNPRHGIFTWVVTKQDNEWLLLAVHNVNVKRPLPNKRANFASFDPGRLWADDFGWLGLFALNA